MSSEKMEAVFRIKGRPYFSKMTFIHGCILWRYRFLCRRGDFLALMRLLPEVISLRAGGVVSSSMNSLLLEYFLGERGALLSQRDSKKTVSSLLPNAIITADSHV